MSVCIGFLQGNGSAVVRASHVLRFKPVNQDLTHLVVDPTHLATRSYRHEYLVEQTSMEDDHAHVPGRVDRFHRTCT
jgi:hypothetical protein